MVWSCPMPFIDGWSDFANYYIIIISRFNEAMQRS